MNTLVRTALGISIMLMLLSLVACSRCSDSAPKKGAPGSPSTEASPGVDGPSTLTESAQRRFEMGDYREAIRMARAAFDEAYAKNPKAPETWAIYLKICEAQAKMDSPQAPGCYDRFFSETESVKMDERVMATALRWRLIISLEQGKALDATRHMEKLDAIEQRLIMLGQMRRHEQAYSAYIRGGVMQLKGDIQRAITEFQRAVALHKESGERNPQPLLDYLDRLALAYATAERYPEALRTLKEAEDLYISLRGKIHPDVAVVRLKRINVLLDMGESLQARGEWDYVHQIIGQFRKDELPPEIDTLYVETMIRFDSEGVFGVKP